MRIITIIGARPQFIKAAMLSKAIQMHPEYGISEQILHTGQHYDYAMSEIFFQELGIPAPKWNLGCIDGPEVMCEKILPILQAEKPDWVVVYGDTNSTLGGALAAEKAGIPIAHIEAGLRSFNDHMPEEHNRIETDKRSTLLFCPTHTAIAHLKNEGITRGVHHVGDIMYDAALCFHGNEASILTELNISCPYYLATVHRAENTDNRERLLGILQAFTQIDTTIVWPMHPRTHKVISQDAELSKMLEQAKSLHIIDSQSYINMSALEEKAEVILTDSGGVQKEAYFHRTPCITLRDETEWVETIEAGWNQLTGANCSHILAAITNTKRSDKNIEEYGDGHTAEKILQCLLAY